MKKGGRGNREKIENGFGLVWRVANKRQAI